jgi:hypothetical protein
MRILRYRCPSFAIRLLEALEHAASDYLLKPVDSSN